MDSIRVTSWNELSEVLFEGSWNSELGRYRSNMVYRGLSRADYPLATTLIRLGGHYPRLEGHMLRNFRKYAHRSALHGAPGESVWSWLAVAQHHGLPTRLLDWTHSPLIAAHFATANLERYEADGAIWCVDYVKANEHLPDQLTTIMRQEGSNGSFTVEMLARAARTLHDFDRLRGSPFVVFLEPPSLDDRIVNQYELFSLMNEATLALDDWLSDKPHLFRRIVIPAEVKWEVRDKLDQSNITERVLFPGLDGLSRWLARHYSPSTLRSLRLAEGESDMIDGTG